MYLSNRLDVFDRQCMIGLVEVDLEDLEAVLRARHTDLDLEVQTTRSTQRRRNSFNSTGGSDYCNSEVYFFNIYLYMKSLSNYFFSTQKKSASL